MFNIDFEKLHSLERAFVIYEIASHGVDPRETLEGTTFRIYEREGYKQDLYDEIHGRIENGGPYVDIAYDALSIMSTLLSPNEMSCILRRYDLPCLW